MGGDSKARKKKKSKSSRASDRRQDDGKASATSSATASTLLVSTTATSSGRGGSSTASTLPLASAERSHKKRRRSSTSSSVASMSSLVPGSGGSSRRSSMGGGPPSSRSSGGGGNDVSVSGGAPSLDRGASGATLPTGVKRKIDLASVDQLANPSYMAALGAVEAGGHCKLVSTMETAENVWLPDTVLWSLEYLPTDIKVTSLKHAHIQMVPPSACYLINQGVVGFVSSERGALPFAALYEAPAFSAMANFFPSQKDDSIALGTSFSRSLRLRSLTPAEASRLFRAAADPAAEQALADERRAKDVTRVPFQAKPAQLAEHELTKHKFEPVGAVDPPSTYLAARQNIVYPALAAAASDIAGGENWTAEDETALTGGVRVAGLPKESKKDIKKKKAKKEKKKAFQLQQQQQQKDLLQEQRSTSAHWNETSHDEAGVVSFDSAPTGETDVSDVADSLRKTKKSKRKRESSRPSSPVRLMSVTEPVLVTPGSPAISQQTKRARTLSPSTVVPDGPGETDQENKKKTKKKKEEKKAHIHAEAPPVGRTADLMTSSQSQPLGIEPIETNMVANAAVKREKKHKKTKSKKHEEHKRESRPAGDAKKRKKEKKSRSGHASVVSTPRNSGRTFDDEDEDVADSPPNFTLAHNFRLAALEERERQ